MELAQFNTSSSSPFNLQKDWDIKCQLAQGSTCNIALIESSPSKEQFAMKIFNPEVNSSVIQTEAKILSQVSCQRIIKAYGFFEGIQFSAQKGSNKFQEEDGEIISLPALVLEYAPRGDLVDLMQKLPCFPEIVARTYFKQLVEAIECLHEKNICHLDLKPDNILLDDNFCVKLADFGYSRFVSRDSKLKVALGTQLYHAPEIHRNVPYDAYKADLFALGMILFMLVGGCFPFGKAICKDPFYRLIIKQDFSRFWASHEELKGSQQQFYSNDFRNLVESMLAYDPEKRTTLGEIKNHPWFQGITLSDEKMKSFFSGKLSFQKEQKQ